MSQKMKHVSFSVMVLSLLLLHGPGWGQSQLDVTKNQTDLFAVRAFHLPVRQFRTVAYYQQIMDDLAERDYNMVVLQLGGIYTSAYTVPDIGKLSFKNWSHVDIKQLIDHARSKGLEPVIGIKIINKLAVVMSNLERHYPGVLINMAGRSRGMINMNYHFDDGRDAYEAVILPMINGMIDLYGDQRPKYILLGNDEIPVEDLQNLGEKMGMDASQYMAECINRCTEYVLSKNITPILWGDMFLSARLAGPESGVKGFDGDLRFSEGGSDHYHAEYYQNDKLSVVTAMNDLKYRDRIIMAHWFYWPRKGGEYPAIDYFQAMGFKDVWGCTWFDEWTMRHLSQYVAKRKGGGMMATSWNIAYSSSQSYRLKPIIDNSAVYFKDPNFQPAPDTEKVLLGGKSMPWSIKPGDSLPIIVTLPQSVQSVSDALLWLTSDRKKEPMIRMPLVWDKNAHTLKGLLQIPQDCKVGKLFDMGIRYTDTNTRYTKQIYRSEIVAAVLNDPTSAGATEGWLNIDLSSLGSKPIHNDILRIPGEYGGWLLLSDAKLGRFDKSSYLTPPLKLWERMVAEGFTMTIECMLTDPYPNDDPLAAKARPYTALLTFGSYNQGLRLLYDRNGDILLQFGNTRLDGKPAAVTFPKALCMNKWSRVTITLEPADSQSGPRFTLSVDGQNSYEAQIQTMARITTLPLILGSAFGVGTTTRIMPDFPGKIRRLKIGPLAQTRLPAIVVP